MKTNRFSHLLVITLVAALTAAPLAAIEPVRAHPGYVSLALSITPGGEIWTDMRPMALGEAELETKRWPITVEGHGKGEVLLELDPHGRIAFLGVTENLKDAKLEVEVERIESTAERNADTKKCVVEFTITVPTDDGGIRLYWICIFPFA